MNVAINGFGRIGRLTLRYLLEMDDINVVAINDLTDDDTLAHLMQFDSTQGTYPAPVRAEDGNLIIGEHKIRTFGERDPGKLPWADLGVHTVIECTGVFRTVEKVQPHLDAGAKRILLSAPAKGSGFKTVVLGINHDIIEKDDVYISNASCTTNCLAPVVKVLHEHFGVKRGTMSTIHAYTADQNIQDAPHRDLRRARAAAVNIVPTSTGAAKALGIVMPEMAGRIQAVAIRVPVPVGSLVDITVETEKTPTRDDVNAAFKAAAQNEYPGMLEYRTEPLVSSDILGNPNGSIFDSLLTDVSNGLVRVTSWYDNEDGYSARLAELTKYLAKL